ncbi:MAG: trypsin-like peptidase domain-containing protein, partial [Planctomycetota bacterium]
MNRIGLLGWLWVGTIAAGSPPSDELRMRRTPVVEAYERARDSVVNISTTQKIRVSRPGLDIFGFPDVFSVPAERSSVGSGFVIHEDGYIATNAHVVSAADRLQITFADGATHEAEVIGRDNLRDLAVIKIEPEKPLKPIRMGRSDDLIIGEPVLAIGNPVGLQNTLTTGVV